MLINYDIVYGMNTQIYTQFFGFYNITKTLCTWNTEQKSCLHVFSLLWLKGNQFSIVLVPEGNKRTYLFGVLSVLDVFSCFLFSGSSARSLEFFSLSSHENKAHNRPLNFLATKPQHIIQKYPSHVKEPIFGCFQTKWAGAFLSCRHVLRMLLQIACMWNVQNCICNVWITLFTWKVWCLNQCRYFAVLSNSWIEQHSRPEYKSADRPEYKSADPNWFTYWTSHALNSYIRFGTWKVWCLNRAHNLFPAPFQSFHKPALSLEHVKVVAC